MSGDLFQDTYIYVLFQQKSHRTKYNYVQSRNVTGKQATPFPAYICLELFFHNLKTGFCSIVNNKTCWDCNIYLNCTLLHGGHGNGGFGVCHIALAPHLRHRFQLRVEIDALGEMNTIITITVHLRWRNRHLPLCHKSWRLPWKILESRWTKTLAEEPE